MTNIHFTIGVDMGIGESKTVITKIGGKMENENKVFKYKVGQRLICINEIVTVVNLINPKNPAYDIFSEKGGMILGVEERYLEPLEMSMPKFGRGKKVVFKNSTGINSLPIEYIIEGLYLNKGEFLYYLRPTTCQCGLQFCVVRDVKESDIQIFNQKPNTLDGEEKKYRFKVGDFVVNNENKRMKVKGFIQDSLTRNGYELIDENNREYWYFEEDLKLEDRKPKFALNTKVLFKDPDSYPHFSPFVLRHIFKIEEYCCMADKETVYTISISIKNNYGNESIVFRGVLESQLKEAHETQLRNLDEEIKVGDWVELNDTQQRFKVVKIDQAHDTRFFSLEGCTLYSQIVTGKL